MAERILFIDAEVCILLGSGGKSNKKTSGMPEIEENEFDTLLKDAGVGKLNTMQVKN